MKKLLVRSISGLVYVALIVCPIYLKIPGLYVAVFSLMAVLSVREFSQLVGLNRKRWLRTILDCLAGGYLFMAHLFYCTNIIGAEVFFPYLFYFMYTMIRNIYSDKQFMVRDTSLTFMAHLYAVCPLLFANLIAFPGTTNNFTDLRSGMLLTIFILIWASDTFAFIGGSLFGKHKLFPSVSPNKTWEGFITGAISSVVIATLVGYYLIDIPSASIYMWPVLGIVVAATSTWGDLFESNLKRLAGVKDSGHLIPGHGGMLDRIDSALFALPAAYFVYSVFLN
ncbi:phosphatidate cytidylyltransferase [Falsiporphyromonas endometrii]|uniref:Phosphatidate cytidylyltransferase n=1 Tax=Falsiporphyromonas endometrii TaxID=1387297 RepID=A0ABV9KAE3_9PORP